MKEEETIRKDRADQIICWIKSGDEYYTGDG